MIAPEDCACETLTAGHAPQGITLKAPGSMADCPSGRLTTTSQVRVRLGPPDFMVTVAVSVEASSTVVLDTTGAGPLPPERASTAPSVNPPPLTMT